MNPSYDFTGRVAFITGASSGMGLAAVWAFAEAGAAVTLADVNDDALASAEGELRGAGHRVLAVPPGSPHWRSAPGEGPPPATPSRHPDAWWQQPTPRRPQRHVPAGGG